MKGIKSEKGQILIITFIVMVLLIAITSAFLFMTSARLRNFGYTIESAKAFWLAEAGLQQGIYTIKSEPDFRDNCNPNCDPIESDEDWGGGSYYVSVSKNGYYILTSTGTVGDLERTVTMSVAFSLGAFDYAIHASSSIHFQQAEGIVEGDISANGSIVLSDDMTINGVVYEDSEVITPSVNFAYYLSQADHLIDGDMTFIENDPLYPSGYSGIWYITGKANIEDNVTINGTIVTMGNISFKNNAHDIIITAEPAHYPALISKGNIQAQKLYDSTITGVVYAEGNLTFQNMYNTIFIGTIISDKNVQMQHDADSEIIYNPDVLLDNPPGFSGGETIIPQLDWQEIPAS